MNKEQKPLFRRMKQCEKVYWYFWRLLNKPKKPKTMTINQFAKDYKLVNGKWEKKSLFDRLFKTK